MERVRRVASTGGFNYLGLTGTCLLVSANKGANIVFDSMKPLTEDVDEEVGEGGKAEAPAFYWSQLPGEDLEVWLYVGEVLRSQVAVSLVQRDLEVKVRGVSLLRGRLQAPVEQDSWTWSLSGGKLTLLLTKVSEGPWPGLWARFL